MSSKPVRCLGRHAQIQIAMNTSMITSVIDAGDVAPDRVHGSPAAGVAAAVSAATGLARATLFTPSPCR